jgi:hypothetical protein
MLKNYFSQLLNVHGVSDVRQIEIQTAEPWTNDRSPLEAETAVAKLKRNKSPGSDQIPADDSDKRQTRPLVREGAPERQDPNSQTVINI